jgi:hypothetical protein
VLFTLVCSAPWLVGAIGFWLARSRNDGYLPSSYADSVLRR